MQDLDAALRKAGFAQARAMDDIWVVVLIVLGWSCCFSTKFLKDRTYMHGQKRRANRWIPCFYENRRAGAGIIIWIVRGTWDRTPAGAERKQTKRQSCNGAKQGRSHECKAESRRVRSESRRMVWPQPGQYRAAPGKARASTLCEYKPQPNEKTHRASGAFLHVPN